MANYDGTGIELFNIPSFQFESGDKVDIHVAYRVYNKDATKGTVLVPTCYSGKINETTTFYEGALKEYRVVCVAMLGNAESSAASTEPKFPKKLDYRDVIRSQYQLMTEHFKVKELQAVIGFSMGGQQTYYWAAMYPDFVRHAVVLCGSARTSFHNQAFLEGPKSVLQKSEEYATYKQTGKPPVNAVRGFSRAYLGWLWSYEWFRDELWKSDKIQTFEKYVEQVGERNFDGWDPEDLLIHATMWQGGDIGKTRKDGSLEGALGDIKAKVLLMPSRTDQYFRWEDNEAELKYLKHGRLAIIESIWGHPAGGGGHEPDTKFMDEQISKFIES